MLQCGTVLRLSCQLQRSYTALLLHLRAQKYANQTSFDVFYTLHVLCKSTAKYVMMLLDVNCKTITLVPALSEDCLTLMTFRYDVIFKKVNYQYKSSV